MESLELSELSKLSLTSGRTLCSRQMKNWCKVISIAVFEIDLLRH